jgi:hypothetical protein
MVIPSKNAPPLEESESETETEKKSTKEYSSSTQKFLEVYYTPELLSN